MHIIHGFEGALAGARPLAAAALVAACLALPAQAWASGVADDGEGATSAATSKSSAALEADTSSVIVDPATQPTSASGSKASFADASSDASASAETAASGAASDRSSSMTSGASSSAAASKSASSTASSEKASKASSSDSASKGASSEDTAASGSASDSKASASEASSSKASSSEAAAKASASTSGSRASSAEKTSSSATSAKAPANTSKTSKASKASSSEAAATSAKASSKVSKTSKASKAAKRGWVEESGEVRYYGSNGKAHTGWLVTDTYKDYGLQRYWFGSDGVLARSRLVSKSEAGWWAYATKRGYVVRGRYKTGKLVYLADNDGRLEDAGWTVSDSYGQGLQRYWVDSAKHAAVAGFSKDGWAHYTTSKGYVLRGKKRVGDGMLLADNDGVLVESVAKEGWLVTKRYDGELQRYRIDGSCKGHLGAHLGYFTIGKNSYYGRYDQGYVVRNVVYKAPDGNRYYGDNDGVLKPLRTGAYQRSDGSYDWYNSNGDCDRAGAINKILSTAYSLLGVPYVWLGVYPQDGGMDCASFTWYLYKQLGIDIGFETYDQMYSGVAVSSLSEAKPGDLILMYDNGWPNYTPGLYEHVVLYAGGGMIYEEPTFGGQCQYVSLSSKGAGNLRIRRIIAD